MALQCEVCILVAQLYFTSKVITNKSQVGYVSTGKNLTKCLPMVIIRWGEGDRGRGRFALLDNITRCGRVGSCEKPYKGNHNEFRGCLLRQTG
jgi:hypothetical protein